jgi:hypothetical protein
VKKSKKSRSKVKLKKEKIKDKCMGKRKGGSGGKRRKNLWDIGW